MAMSWMTPSLHGDVVGDINAAAESGGIADMNANAEASGVAMASVHGKTTAYVCEGTVCQKPTADPAVFAKQLKRVIPYSP